MSSEDLLLFEMEETKELFLSTADSHKSLEYTQAQPANPIDLELTPLNFQKNMSSWREKKHNITSWTTLGTL